MIDGGVDPVLVDPEFARDQLVGKGDRLGLEIVAEREIPEHFKERMVPRGVTDVVQIVVLATRADAFLRGRRAVVVALLDAGEAVLELHHPRVDEHKRRIVARHERAGRDDLVPLLLEVVQKCGTDVVQACHVSGPLCGLSGLVA
ncbi:hypothetical protein SSE37_04995 [Sagittula stellata E-37]|uniref:Uncharacterized protein n=1 Tax=Sagittula stellata (strain ATCC 700073 / DSM 11524 / E-37) TaxID=388399 RepID=A3K229_SAGS3|nr:hypothetical protein SSE37_04995 [Sagittula stellata E-37]